MGAKIDRDRCFTREEVIEDTPHSELDAWTERYGHTKRQLDAAIKRMGAAGYHKVSQEEAHELFCCGAEVIRLRCALHEFVDRWYVPRYAIGVYDLVQRLDIWRPRELISLLIREPAQFESFNTAYIMGGEDAVIAFGNHVGLNIGSCEPLREVKRRRLEAAKKAKEQHGRHR